MKKQFLSELNKARGLMGLPLLTEDEANGRISMAQSVGRVTSDVDTLLQWITLYQPDDYWTSSIGYISNSDPNRTVNPDPEIERLAGEMDDDYFKSMINNPEYSAGKMKHPHAKYQEKGVKYPSTMYKLKSFTVQWLSNEARNELKAKKDAEVTNIYKKYGISPEEGSVDPWDKRGSGWEDLPGTPFQKHVGNEEKPGTGNIRYAEYRKVGGLKDGVSVYFIKKGNDIIELTNQQVDFLFKLGPKAKSGIPKRLMQIQDEKARNEIFELENQYEFKNLNLDKMAFIYCSGKDRNGETLKFEYINTNAAPEGVNPGEFKSFIEDYISKYKNK